MKILLSKKEPNIVRLNAFRSIELLVLNPEYAEVLVKQGAIPFLINCLDREIEEVKIIILDALNRCLVINPDEGLDADGICVFNNLLVHDDSTIRHKSAQAMLRLVVSDQGKIQALQKKVVPRLIQLLVDTDSEARASAAGALAFICVKTAGRYACLDGDAIPNLVKCLLNPNSRARVNALKIESLMADENAAVRKHAETTADVIKWKPWDLEVRCRGEKPEEKQCACKH
ncbi:hypothetical protein Aperf_G00000075233 [Anoplocephala perfoliata]